MRPVKGFYGDFCEGCILNGCYPWNRNPAICCSTVGGLYPPTLDVRTLGSTKCDSRQLVTFLQWQKFVVEAQKEAKENEQLRLEVWRGKEIMSNQRQLWWPKEEER